MAGLCFQFAESGTCRFGDLCKYSHVAKKKAPQGKRDKAGNTNKKNLSISRLLASDLDAFFAQYSTFDYDPSTSSSEEFYRLCDFFEWDRDDPDRKEAHESFKTALVKQFNSLYGTEVDDIESWRGLCLALDIVPLPTDVSEAKEIFKGRFVNLVDLVDAPTTGHRASQFDTLEELKEYTITSGKFFPKESAYAGGMLKFLLREILSKYEGRVSRRRRR